MKKLFVFLTILITIFGFTSFVQAQVSSDSSHYDDEGATSKYEVEPTRVLITFNRELFDLRTESGEKEALQYINTLSWEDPFVAGNLKGEKSMIFIKDQNLAIVRIFPVDLDGEKSGVYIPIAKSVVSQIRKAYFQGKKVGEAQLNFKYRLLGQSQTPTFKPSDPYFKSQSNLFAKFYINDKSIGFSADEAWDFTERKVYEGRGVYKGKYTQDVVVAILDDGLTDSSYISPDISPILWKAKDDVCVDYNYKKIKCPFGG